MTDVAIDFVTVRTLCVLRRLSGFELQWLQALAANHASGGLSLADLSAAADEAQHLTLVCLGEASKIRDGAGAMGDRIIGELTANVVTINHYRSGLFGLRQQEATA